MAQANHTAEQVAAEAQSRGQAEYERIIASAGGGAARWPASGRSRSRRPRLGEIVLDTVEKIIGREVDAAAHRDLIDEAIEALRATRRRRPAAAGAGASVNPAIQGYGAAVLAEAEAARARPVAAELRAVDRLVADEPRPARRADRHRHAARGPPGGRR